MKFIKTILNNPELFESHKPETRSKRLEPVSEFLIYNFYMRLVALSRTVLIAIMLLETSEDDSFLPEWIVQRRGLGNTPHTGVFSA